MSYWKVFSVFSVFTRIAFLFFQLSKKYILKTIQNGCGKTYAINAIQTKNQQRRKLERCDWDLWLVANVCHSNFVRRSNDCMILCEFQLSHRMFIETISSTWCFTVDLIFSLAFFLTVHLSLFSHLLLPETHVSMQLSLCLYYIREYFVLHRNPYFNSWSCKMFAASTSIFFHYFQPARSWVHSLLCITLMLMILRVFDKLNDWWKWQHQTWKGWCCFSDFYMPYNSLLLSLFMSA